MVRIGILKTGNIATSLMVDLLLDERAEREDIEVRVFGSGAKLDEKQLELCNKLLEFEPDLIIYVTPNCSLSVPRKIIKKLCSFPLIVISDSPGIRVKEELEKKGVLKVKVNGKEYEITAEDVEIIEVLPEGYVGEKFKGGMAYLYTVRDEKLIAEGYARDVVRRIQEMRKQLDLNIEEEIVVYLSLPENLRKYVEMFLDYVKRETRARDISFKEPRGYIKEWNIDGVKVIIGVER